MSDFIFNHIDLLIDLVLAFITMSLGLSLTKDDFRHLFVNPRSFTIGLTAQMILLPFVAFLLMLMSDFSPATKVGFIIITLCPGGVTSNLVSYLLRGNVALSISLTVVNGLLCMFTIPFLANLALQYFMHDTHEITLPFFRTLLQIALVTILPAIVGIIIRNRLPRVADGMQPVLKYLLPLLLLFIFTIKIFAGEDKGGTGLTSAELWDQAPWVLLLNFLGMFLGFLLGLVFGIRFKNKITIIIEVGLHNTALALLIAGNLLRNADMQKPAMVYAIFTFFSTLVFAWLIREGARRLLKEEY